MNYHLILKRKEEEGRKGEDLDLEADQEIGIGSMKNHGTKPKDQDPSIKNLRNTRLKRKVDIQIVVTRNQKHTEEDTDPTVLTETIEEKSVL